MYWNIFHPHCGPGNSIYPDCFNEIDRICREHDIRYTYDERGVWYMYLNYNQADEDFLEAMSDHGGFLPTVYRTYFQAKKAVSHYLQMAPPEYRPSRPRKRKRYIIYDITLQHILKSKKRRLDAIEYAREHEGVVLDNHMGEYIFNALDDEQRGDDPFFDMDVEPPPIEDEKINPDVEQSETVAPRILAPVIDMSSVNKQVSLVDLGSFNVRRKGGNSFNVDDVESTLYTGVTDFGVLASTANNEYHNILYSGNLWNRVDNTTNKAVPSFSREFLGFNTVYQRQELSTSFGLTKPQFNQSANDTLDNPNDWRRLLMLRNQYVELYFKNITANSTQEGTKSSLTPVHLKVYLLQCKESFKSEVTSASNYSTWVAEGFDNFFEGSGVNSIQQYPWVTSSMNSHIAMHWDFVDKKEIVLEPGQTVKMSAFLPGWQVLSYKPLLDPQYIGGGTGGFLPIHNTVGEQVFFVEFHGGIQQYSEAVTFEAAKLSYYGFMSYEAGISRPDSYNNIIINQVPSVTAINEEIDPDHNEGDQ